LTEEGEVTAAITVLPSSSWFDLSALMYGLGDGESMLRVVAIDTDDVVVEVDVVEILDTAD
jgi:hypothetical protein